MVDSRIDLMKKLLLVLSITLGLVAVAPEPARADVDFGITVGGPAYYDAYPVYYGPAYGEGYRSDGPAYYYYRRHYRPNYYYHHPYHYGYWHRGPGWHRHWRHCDD
jgi:hypothetical protein